MSSLRFDDVRSASGSTSPLDRLYRRERETACVIYERGPSTAAEVQSALTDPLSNATVRSMLNRLVRKGILTRIQCGSHGEFVYAAALNNLSIQERELLQFADDFFGGSVEQLTLAIGTLWLQQKRKVVQQG
jgi:predicted transcriptional regulator